MQLFICYDGGVIDTESGHIDYIVESLSDDGLSFMSPEYVKVIKKIRRYLKKNEDESMEEVLDRFGVGADEIVFDFCNRGLVVRVYDDSILIPDSGVTMQQFMSIKECVVGEYIYIRWKGIDYKIEYNLFRVADNFKNIKKNMEKV